MKEKPTDDFFSKEGIIKNTLNKALNLIVELEPDFICEELHLYAEECEYCANNCKNLTKECVLRYLKYK